MRNAITAQAIARRFWLLGLGFVLLGMSIAGFVFGVITVVAIGLVWAWVAIPVLIAMAASTRALTNVQRSLAGRILGAPIPRPYLPVPAGGWFVRLRGLARDPASWRDLAWLFVNFSVGFTLLVVMLSLFLGGVFQVVFPLVWALWPGAFAGYYGLFRIDSLAEAVLIAWPVAAGYAALWWWLSPILMRAYALLARSLLAPTEGARLARRVRQLSESRAETVDTQAAELRRIERDLHDGAQARLVALAMSLGMADEVLDRDPAAARALLAEARGTTGAALTELRDLVRGIHPPVLADRGLDGAVRALALASPLPVDVEIDLPRRPPAPVESAAYFAVAEAITNVIKHSGATKAWARLSYADDRLSMLVADDGRGGAELAARRPADPAAGTGGAGAGGAGGTGLRGIERRLAAFDGTVVVSSPAGGPTVVTMELPCVLSSPRTSPSSGTA